MIILFAKARISAHVRRTASGKVVAVREYVDKRQAATSHVPVKRATADTATGDLFAQPSPSAHVTPAVKPVAEPAKAADGGEVVDIGKKAEAHKAATLQAMTAHGWKDEGHGSFSRTIRGGVTGGFVNPTGMRRVFARIEGGQLVAKHGDRVVARVAYGENWKPERMAAALDAAVDAIDKDAEGEKRPDVIHTESGLTMTRVDNKHATVFKPTKDKPEGGKDWRDEENWHTRTMERFKTLPVDSLVFIRQDASEAADNAEKMGSSKAGQYRDEAHYASMELKRRMLEVGAKPAPKPRRKAK